MHSWSPPTSFDGYQVLRRIGRGGMGEVHLALDSLLDRRVAIKFISAGEPDPIARERFMVEARAIARLQHPNVVSIYRVGQVGDIPYLVSEFVEGSSLNQLEKPVPWRKALNIGMGIARALAAAHQRGVLHRDIKPANAMLTRDGEVKLLDFGIAKLLDNRAVPGYPLVSIPCTTGVACPKFVRSSSISITTLPEEAPTGSIPCEAPAIHRDSTASLTEVGYAVGTPAYMAPEILAGEQASFRSDVYSLGVLLYELVASRLPKEERIVGEEGRVSLRPHPSLAMAAADVDESFAAVVDRCLHKDPKMRFESGNELRSALAQLTPEARLQSVPEGNPYPGLRSFDADRAALYFGRDSEIRDVLERLSLEGFVVVSGDSGVGKSSLCRAGVLPRIQRWFGSDRVWQHATVVPGRTPCRALAQQLAPILHVDVDHVERIIHEDPGELGRLLCQHLTDQQGLVLFVDQFEELATLSDSLDAAAFSVALHWIAVADSSLRVLAAARGDFLGRLTAMPLLGDRIGSALYFLRPLTRERVREAIIAPARAKGVRFGTEEMVDELVEEATGTEGGLPLLQFALAELWMAKPLHSSTISADIYREIGGVRGALARHADQVLASFNHSHRAIAKRILRNLVSGDNTRARRLAQDLGLADPDVAFVLQTLVAGRLVVACDSPDGSAYEIAHEALIRGWSTLAHALAEDMEARAVRDRLRAAVAEWERLGRSRGALWTRKQLREAVVLQGMELSSQEKGYLRACRLHHRLRTGAGVAAAMGVLFTVAAVYGLTTHAQETQRRAHVDGAIGRGEASLAEAVLAVETAKYAERKAFDAFDRGAKDAESLWSHALKKRASIRPLLDRAERQIESAMLLDAARQDIRERFAQILIKQAGLAEGQLDLQERDRALQRVRLYDESGELLRTWSQPRSVWISSKPSGASMDIERFDGMAYVVLSTNSQEGEKALLEPGSYRAALRLSEHAPTHVPFLVQRGEDVRLDVPLVPAEALPEGFVYVPPGVGWYGSASEEGLRSGFFNAPPMHEVSVPGFFIARHEVTHREWLAYLRALSPEERASRLPMVPGAGFHGTLKVTESSTGFELTLRVGKTLHRVAEGEKLVLARRSVDWLSMPVTGISALDAAAYASWLRTSGDVPGARLCSEVEWERAGRGADRRTYPHGDLLAPSQASVDATYDKEPEAMAPDEVGSFPASRSPFEVDDMAGNAWEWTTHAHEPERFVARGGSFYYAAQVARIENREVPEATFRDVSVGLRICADLPSKPGSASQISVPVQRATGSR